ncbi:hypothetical protein BGW80DRAFT_1461181 [Lactifluus volemus]|nr:hypothetical protein BGW80DRAFT_1461181 [Lactifluus volemus]
MSDTDDQVDDSEDDDAKEDAMIWEDLQSDSDGGGSDDLDRNSSSTPPTPATSLPAAATSMAPCVARASPPPSEPIAAPTPPSSLVRSKSRSPLSSERPDAVVAIGSSSNASETSFGPPHKPPHIPRARTSGQAPGEGEAIGTRNSRRLGKRKANVINLNACICGITISDEEIEENTNIMRCRVQGCETVWFHQHCMNYDFAPRNWACESCSAGVSHRRR